MKQYTINGTTVQLKKGLYETNDTLYVGLDSLSDGGRFPYMHLTTNLPDAAFPANAKLQYVKMGMDCGVDRVQFLEENGIAEDVGILARSGFNVYTLMDFSGSLDDMRDLNASRRA